MLKHLKLKTMLLLACLVMGVGSVWAEEVAYQITSKNTLSTTGKAPTGSSATMAETYSTSAQMTGGNSQTLTLKGYDGYTITKLVLYMKSNTKGGAGTLSYSTDGGTNFTYLVGNSKSGVNFNDNSWNGSYSTDWCNVTKSELSIDCNSSDVIFKIAATTNSLYCSKYTITYEASSPSKTKIATIGDLSTTTLNFNDEGTFNPTITPADGITSTDYTVAWEEVLEDNFLLASDGTYEVGTTKGSVDVTVTVTPSASKADDYDAVSKTFTIKIVDPNAHTGLTQEDAFTVEEAIEAIDNGVDSSTDFYVKGIISNVEKYNSSYNSINYWLSDDGLTKAFECYSGKGLNGANFSSIDDLTVGTQVIVKGKLTYYSSGKVYEFGSGNQIVWMKTDDRTNIATINGITPLTVNVDDEGSFTLDIDFATDDPTDYEVILTSSDDSKLTVDNDGTFIVGNQTGSVTITVNVEPVDDETYKAVAESFTITIVDPNVKGTETNPYTVADLIAMNGTAATSDNVYVKGWIVGYLASSTNLITDDASKFAVSNVALADNPTETDINNVVSASFQNNSARTALNLKDNPWNVGVAQVLLNGKLGKSFGKVGLTSVLVASKKVAEQVSISSNGYATYYTDCALDFTDFEDMYAYTATVTDNTVNFTRVEKVPANTGVLLRNPNGGAATNVVPVATTTDNVAGNKLTGTLTDINALASEDGGNVNYILNKVNDVVGFYKANGKKVAAHKAYLQLDAATAKNMTFIGFGEETSVNEELRMMNEEFAPAYNLAGQRVDANFHGIVIQNGKKVSR